MKKCLLKMMKIENVIIESMYECMHEPVAVP